MALAAQHAIPVFPTIKRALCVGGTELAVDAVLLVGEVTAGSPQPLEEHTILEYGAHCLNCTCSLLTALTARQHGDYPHNEVSGHLTALESLNAACLPLRAAMLCSSLQLLRERPLRTPTARPGAHSCGPQRGRHMYPRRYVEAMVILPIDCN